MENGCPFRNSDDPFTARLLRKLARLRKGGSAAGHDVLATYETRAGDAPFAFCRGGLLLRPDRDARYIA